MQLVANSIKVFLCCALIIFEHQAFSQSLHTINYTVEDGLPSSQTYCVVQDSKGYIWIGTDRGVSRFDGYRFINYSTNEGLTDNTIFDILEDSQKRIWFLSFNGKLSYYKNEKIIPYRWNGKLDSALQGIKIARSFFVDENDNLTISYLNRGVITIDAKGKISSSLTVTDSNYNRVFFVENKKGRYFAGTILTNNGNVQEGALIYKKGEKSKSIKLKEAGQISDARVISRKNGNVALVLSKLIFSVSDKNIIQKYYDPSLTIHNIYEDSDSCLWLALRRKGVMRVKANEWPGKNNYEFFLDGKTITSVFQDRDHGFWFSSLEDGIFYSPSILFRYLLKVNDYDLNAVGSVTGEGNHILAGFNNGNIYELKSNNVKKVYAVTDKEDASDFVQCLMYDKENKTIWSGTSKNIWRIEEGKKPEVVIRSSTRSVSKSLSGDIWAGGQALIKIGKGGVIQQQLIRGFKNRIEIVFPASDGTIWVGEMDGLFFKQGDSIIKYNYELLNTRVSSISENSAADLIIGTLGKGLIIKNRKKFTQISTENGLSGNLINSVFVDGDEIWTAGNGGLDRIVWKNGEILSIENFNMYHGLPTHEVKQIYKNRDTVWLATNKGLVYFLYGQFRRNTSPPGIYFDQIRVNNLEISSAEIEFSYDKNFMTFDFTGISFHMNRNIEYKYRLVGLSDEWLNTKNTSVSFASLAPGEYTFEVVAKNEDGVWSENPASYAFIILPPFWETWWFYLLEFLGLVMIGLIIYWIMKRRIRERNKVFEFQQQALTAQMNPHFIFNTLNSIQSYVLKEDRLSATRYLSKFSQLMRKSLEHSRTKLVTLQKEMELITSYLDLEVMRYKDKFIYEFKIDETIDTENIFVPTMILQPFIENSIIHGVIHKNDSTGLIKVSIKLENGHLVCLIDDNGIGRLKSKEMKTEKLNKQSVGIAITEERLRIMSRELKTEYSLKLEDKYSPDLQPLGTIITFNLPYQRKYAQSDLN